MVLQNAVLCDSFDFAVRSKWYWQCEYGDSDRCRCDRHSDPPSDMQRLIWSPKSRNSRQPKHPHAPSVMTRTAVASLIRPLEGGGLQVNVPWKSAPRATDPADGAGTAGGGRGSMVVRFPALGSGLLWARSTGLKVTAFLRMCPCCSPMGDWVCPSAISLTIAPPQCCPPDAVLPND